MARIRTIKPEFFTSEDIVSLSPMARLLYVALWCEADKEGRLVWKPFTFKLRYFPADNCDIAGLCNEIASAGLVVLYGEGYAYIPSFKAHQHINPRESVSQLPDPDAHDDGQPRVATRQSRVSDASARVTDAQGGREGNGREGNEEVAKATFVGAEPPTPSDTLYGGTVDHGGTDAGEKIPPCPHRELLVLFSQHLPTMPQPRPEVWGASKSAAHLKARWRWLLTARRANGGERYATTSVEALDWFGRFFAYVAESDFLTGRKGDFRCTLQWLVTADNFGKVLQGNYANGGAA